MKLEKNKTNSKTAAGFNGQGSHPQSQSYDPDEANLQNLSQVGSEQHGLKVDGASVFHASMQFFLKGF